MDIGRFGPPFAQEAAQHSEGWAIVSLEGGKQTFIGALAARARQYEQAASVGLVLGHYSPTGSGLKLVSRSYTSTPS